VALNPLGDAGKAFRFFELRKTGGPSEDFDPLAATQPEPASEILEQTVGGLVENAVLLV